MIDHVFTRLASAFLILMTVGCSTESIPVQPEIPGSTEPIDIASLNGKEIDVQTIISGDFSTNPPRGTDRFRVVGKTIIFGGQWQASRCLINGQDWGWGMAILFTLDQPRSNVEVPCEGQRVFDSGGYITNSPADVVYTSNVAVHGNTLELSGELREHNSQKYEGSLNFTVTADVTERLHARFRLSADKCQVLDFGWMTDLQELHSRDARPTPEKRSERATGCSIVTPPH